MAGFSIVMLSLVLLAILWLLAACWLAGYILEGLGLSAMGGMEGVLFSVCDQPFLTTDSIIRLLHSFEQSKNAICALSWQGQRGNPVIFPADLFMELAALTGDTGGGAVIRRHPERLALVEAGSPRELADLDRREDWLFHS